MKVIYLNNKSKYENFRVYLDVIVGVEETETDEGEHFLSDVVARSRQVWQHLHHGAHVVQFKLEVVDQGYLSTTSNFALFTNHRSIIFESYIFYRDVQGSSSV